MLNIMMNIKFYFFCFYKYIEQIVNKKYFTKYQNNCNSNKNNIFYFFIYLSIHNFKIDIKYKIKIYYFYI